MKAIKLTCLVFILIITGCAPIIEIIGPSKVSVQPEDGTKGFIWVRLSKMRGEEIRLVPKYFYKNSLVNTMDKDKSSFMFSIPEGHYYLAIPQMKEVLQVRVYRDFITPVRIDLNVNFENHIEHNLGTAWREVNIELDKLVVEPPINISEFRKSIPSGQLKKPTGGYFLIDYTYDEQGKEVRMHY